MNEMAPPLQPAGGAEGTSGGAVSVLSSPPPPSYQVLAALDDLLRRQEAHRKALTRLRIRLTATLCLLTAAVAVSVLYGG